MTKSQESQGNEEWRERLALWLRAHNEQRLSGGQDGQDGQDGQATASQPDAASAIGLPGHVLEVLEASPATTSPAPDASKMRSLLGMDPPLARYGH